MRDESGKDGSSLGFAGAWYETQRSRVSSDKATLRHDAVQLPGPAWRQTTDCKRSCADVLLATKQRRREGGRVGRRARRVDPSALVSRAGCANSWGAPKPRGSSRSPSSARGGRQTFRRSGRIWHLRSLGIGRYPSTSNQVAWRFCSAPAGSGDGDPTAAAPALRGFRLKSFSEVTRLKSRRPAPACGHADYDEGLG